ncbi:MAG: CARDB domain-containing protein [Chitinophagales bacterium]
MRAISWKVGIAALIMVFMLTSVISLTWLVQPVYAADNKDISASFTDSNFKQAVWEWLGRTGDPGTFTKQDLINNMEPKNYQLDLSGKQIGGLAGLENFEGMDLKTLYCYGNQLTSLPKLPISLETLSCEQNQLTSLSKLPSSLEILSCGGNQLTSLPKLPSSLETLRCEQNQLTSLPDLPGNLTRFKCECNYINVFSSDLAAQINNIPEKTTTPQYRFNCIGPLTVGNTPVQISSLKRQQTGDGTYWGKDESITELGKFRFSSSDKKVAKVDKSGLITACGGGTCKIYALYNGVDSEYARAEIPVTVPWNLSVTLNAPADVVAGTKISVTAVVTNEGGAMTPPNMVEFQLGDQKLTKKLSKLKPGKSKTFKVKMSVPDTTGVFGLTAKLVSSAGDEVPNNNQAQCRVAVYQPDLRINKENHTDDGSNVTVNLEIANLTIAPAGKFVVRIYGDENQILAEKKVSGLKQGTMILTIIFKTPDGFAGGSAKAIIDVYNQVEEGDEGNNEFLFDFAP